jgi:glutamate synthase domain-containing protein 2
MRYLLLPFTRRYVTFAGAIAAAILLLPLSFNDTVYWFPFGLAAMLAFLGTHDLLQTQHSLLRNYPIVGHIRFLLEEIRPEIRQYFAESDTDGQPFSRSERTLAYERAKAALDKFPFGTELDVNATSFEWLNHTIAPKAGCGRAVPHRRRWPQLSPTVFNFGSKHLRHELRRTRRQGDSRSEFGSKARRFRA